MRSRVLLFTGVLVLTGCGGGDTATPPPDPVASSSTTSTTAAATSATTTRATTTARPGTTTASPATTTRRQAQAPVVVLDPGHNGANAANPDAITRQVPAGRGRMKDCNTTGTATDGGYPEHVFNFDVARRVGRELAKAGIRVEYTRDSDDGVGPCVDERAAIGNRAGAAAVVSIHADGADPGSRGFHIAYSSPPLNDAQGEPTLRLAETMAGAFSDAGYPVADYIGGQGLSPRHDLAGMNLSTRPAVLVECGNMRNAEEAAVMGTSRGRQAYADAITSGLLTYLGR